MKTERRNTPREPSLSERIIRSVFPEPIVPRPEEQHKRYLLKNLILHFRPTTVPAKTLKFSLSWGLGGMAAVLVLIQFGSGILLKFAYEPTTVAAYLSVQSIVTEVPFGTLIRNLHYWGANLLVAVVFLHMLRIVFTGAFHAPRQFNWIIGLTMFLVILSANFTGYLLPWDQLSYWAITVSTGMLEYIPGIGLDLQEIIRGSSEIGPETLRLFFAFHTAIAPAALLFLMAYHFWRVRKSDGLVVPRAPEEEPEENPARLPVVPDLLLREVVVGLSTFAVVLLLATFLDAPLGEPANPGMSPDPTKAPWYFAGFQEMLLHIHPVVAVFVIPFCAGIALLTIPYLSYEMNTSGIWFASRSGRRMGLIAAGTGLVVTTALVLLDEYLIGPSPWQTSVSPVISTGLIPIAVLLLLGSIFTTIIKRSFKVKQNELVQTFVILLASSFILLTIIGSLFRGTGMNLGWTW